MGRWGILVAAAVALFARQVSGAVTCPKGSLTSADGKVCCPASCTKCGGNACDKLPGGATKCCTGNISRSKKICGKPPCVLPTPATPASKHCGSDNSGILSSDGKVCCAASCKTCSTASCRHDGRRDHDKLCCPTYILDGSKGCGVPPCLMKGTGGPKCTGSQQPCGYEAYGSFKATTCCAAGKVCFAACLDGNVCDTGDPAAPTTCGSELKCPDGGVPCGWDSPDVFDPTAVPRTKSKFCCKKGEFCNAYELWRASPVRRCAPTKVCDDKALRCGYAYNAIYSEDAKIWYPWGGTDPTNCCPRPDMCKLELQPAKDGNFHMVCVDPKKCSTGQTPCGRHLFNINGVEEYSPDTTCCTSKEKCIQVLDFSRGTFDDLPTEIYTYKCVPK